MKNTLYISIILAIIFTISFSYALDNVTINSSVKSNNTLVASNITNTTLAIPSELKETGLKARWGIVQIFIALAVVWIAWVLISVLTRSITPYIGILFIILLILIALVGLLISGVI